MCPTFTRSASTRTAMATPGTPSSRIPAKAAAERDRILKDLSIRWGLIIQPPKDGESPSKRLEKLTLARKTETLS